MLRGEPLLCAHPPSSALSGASCVLKGRAPSAGKYRAVLRQQLSKTQNPRRLRLAGSPEPSSSPVPVSVGETGANPIANWYGFQHLDPRLGGPLRGSTLTHFYRQKDYLTHFHLVLSANN